MPVRRGEIYEGRLKIGGKVVKTKRFATAKEARSWELRMRAAFDDGGYNPASGKVRIEVLLSEWLADRVSRVSPTTLATDRYLKVVLPLWFLKLNANAVTRAHVQKMQDDLLARGLVATSVKRHRESLSSFCGWMVRENYMRINPVAQVPPVKDQRPRDGIRPFNEDELIEVVGDVAALDDVLARIVKVLAWTGIRWGECRAMRVRDFVRVPTPLLQVNRNQPEGYAVKTTKSGKARRVPVADAILPLIEVFALGKGPDDLLFTTRRGAQLHRGRFVRTTSWATTGRSRTLHDLRHTAACMWLMKGVPLGTVSAWLGHSDIATTNRYLHHLGDHADRSALALLNSAGGDSGVTQNREENAG